MSTFHRYTLSEPLDDGSNNTETGPLVDIAAVAVGHMFLRCRSHHSLCGTSSRTRTLHILCSSFAAVSNNTYHGSRQIRCQQHARFLPSVFRWNFFAATTKSIWQFGGYRRIHEHISAANTRSCTSSCCTTHITTSTPPEPTVPGREWRTVPDNATGRRPLGCSTPFDTLATARTGRRRG